MLNYNINPGRDRRLALRLVRLGGLRAQVTDRYREEPPTLYISESRPNPATLDVIEPAHRRQEV